MYISVGAAAMAPVDAQAAVPEKVFARNSMNSINSTPDHRNDMPQRCDT
jgi:hypothetical protein